MYRRASISEVVFHGWDVVSVENPTAATQFPWEVADGNADLVWRPSGLLRKAKEIHYSFAEKDRFSLTTTLPLAMDPENLKKMVISLHGDRSWHEVWAAIELAGKRYEAHQAAFLSSDRWQDVHMAVRRPRRPLAQDEVVAKP